jgi:hypothetical protein
MLVASRCVLEVDLFGMAHDSHPVPQVCKQARVFLWFEWNAMALAETLNAYPLCEQIVQFLLTNEHAMDTVEGIAAWWIRSDTIAVQAALDQLTACGVIAVYPLISGVLYGLTRDEETRARLREGWGTNARDRGCQTLNRDIPPSPGRSQAEP